MSPITKEWVDKAEGDFATAERESKVTSNVNHDATCFHAQQCIEKYFKARLQEAGIAFGKTHDLTTLLALLLPIEPAWSIHKPDLQALNVYAVIYRYPGDTADENEAADAMDKCRALRHLLRGSLKL